MPDIKYGLSATGFKRKRLPEIMQAINARISDTLGLKTQIQSNSVLGQIVGVFSYEIADLWEQAEMDITLCTQARHKAQAFQMRQDWRVSSL